MPRFKSPILIVIILVLWAAPTLALAGEATLENIVITNAGKDLLIYLTIEGGFPGRLE